MAKRKLPPFSARERADFDRSFYGRLRRDAEAATFDYRGHGDARNPKREARRIKEAIAADTPVQIINDVESGIHLMMLCAGYCISLDAPLDAQYLAACQRIADYHGERLLYTPEELARVGALCRANFIVLNALDAFDAWKKGGA